MLPSRDICPCYFLLTSRFTKKFNEQIEDELSDAAKPVTRSTLEVTAFIASISTLLILLISEAVVVGFVSM